MRVWTCPFHEKPCYDDSHYCDCPNCQWMPEVCDWCENGEWWQACDDDGELLYEFVFEGILSLILKEYYMPPLVEQLNSECLLSRFLTDEDDLAVST